MKIFLPDVNVWIALVFESHLHHKAAIRWFNEYPESPLGFCRTTQQGFLRIATNAKAVGDDVLSLPQAWEAYDTIMRDARVSYLPEPVSLETYWRVFTGNDAYSPKIWTDAYLAAFACAADLDMVTLDSGFRRYSDLRLTCLQW